MKKEQSSKKKDEEAEKAAIKAREERIHLHAEAQKKGDRAALRGRIMDFDDDFVAPVHPKEDADRAFLDKALGSNFIFSDLTDGERKLLIDAMQKESADEGDIIIQ